MSSRRSAGILPAGPPASSRLRAGRQDAGEPAGWKPALPSLIDRRVVAETPRFTLADCHCHADPDVPPSDEEHYRACLSFVIGGAFRYRSEKEDASLVPGSVFVGNEGHGYECSHDLGTGDHCLAFRIDASLVADVASSFGVRARFPRLALPPTPRGAALAARVMAAAQGLASAEEVAFDAVAYALTFASPARATRPSFRHLRRAADAAAFLSSHASAQVTLSDAASVAGLSDYHFLRTFRAAVGVTPHQYLIAARLRRAATMLLGTDAPVTEIAYDSGFGDLSNFIRTFRHAAGVPPREFRARLSPRP